MDISNGFELLCNVCCWKFLLIAFVVSLHRQALISCGTKCYFSKLGCQLFLVQCFWKKLKSIHLQLFFSFLVLKISYFFKNGSKTLHIYHYLEKFCRHILSKYRQISKTWGKGVYTPPTPLPSARHTPNLEWSFSPQIVLFCALSWKWNLSFSKMF